ncbi:MAG TPA: fused MFS/spermidine synthase [Propionibacteriaceae bacterium]|nr:fused MFS/spermidine synthase [Propionibacteriaceae bacterium]
MTSNAAAPAGLGPYAAAALVFGASAAVLVVELVALRLLAPYLGLTLETSTIVIGSALAAIAAGSWAGGRLADAVPPRRLLGPLLAISGVAVAATPPLVRVTGSLPGGTLLLMIVAGLGIVVPGTFLSAITPMVTKLRLNTLDQTGRVVGRLSGIGTVGAIVGTVVTGFILISRVPVSGIMIGLGITLIVAAVAVELRFRSWRWAAVPAVLIGLSGVGAAVAPGGCDAETAYHCAVVVDDAERPTGRVLLLDGAPHSYVDLADPTHLEFAYAKGVVAAIDAAFPPGRPLQAYHLGAGALTLPQYLAQTRPGTASVVSEIDPGVVAIDRERLGYDPDRGIEVRVEDGRLGLTRLPAGSQDLVVGDAFGGISVPWHLTTREAVREIERVLTGDGTYVVNMIDRGPLAFARAEVATLRSEFPHVALMARTDTLARTGGGNLVAVASPAPIDTAGIASRLAGTDTGWGVITGAELDAWVDGAPVLTDDYAPVDQLLTPYVER